MNAGGVDGTSQLRSRSLLHFHRIWIDRIPSLDLISHLVDPVRIRSVRTHLFVSELMKKGCQESKLLESR